MWGALVCQSTSYWRSMSTYLMIAATKHVRFIHTCREVGLVMALIDRTDRNRNPSESSIHSRRLSRPQASVPPRVWRIRATSKRRVPGWPTVRPSRNQKVWFVLAVFFWPLTFNQENIRTAVRVPFNVSLIIFYNNWRHLVVGCLPRKINLLSFSLLTLICFSHEVKPVHEDHDGPALRSGLVLYRAHKQDGADNLQVSQLSNAGPRTDHCLNCHIGRRQSSPNSQLSCAEQWHFWEDMATTIVLHRQHALWARWNAVPLIANAYRDGYPNFLVGIFLIWFQ